MDKSTTMLAMPSKSAFMLSTYQTGPVAIVTENRMFLLHGLVDLTISGNAILTTK